jgi:hypothetical protein
MCKEPKKEWNLSQMNQTLPRVDTNHTEWSRDKRSPSVFSLQHAMRTRTITILSKFAFFGQRLAILKLLYVFTRLDQRRKYIVDNEKQISHGHRKKLQMRK